MNQKTLEKFEIYGAETTNRLRNRNHLLAYYRPDDDRYVIVLISEIHDVPVIVMDAPADDFSVEQKVELTAKAKPYERVIPEGSPVRFLEANSAAALRLRMTWIADFLDRAEIKRVCPDCGSDAVAQDAFARWSIELQEWVVVGNLGIVLDSGICNDCENVRKDSGKSLQARNPLRTSWRGQKHSPRAAAKIDWSVMCRSRPSRLCCARLG